MRGRLLAIVQVRNTTQLKGHQREKHAALPVGRFGAGHACTMRGMRELKKQKQNISCEIGAVAGPHRSY